MLLFMSVPSRIASGRCFTFLCYLKTDLFGCTTVSKVPTSGYFHINNLTQSSRQELQRSRTNLVNTLPFLGHGHGPPWQRFCVVLFSSSTKCWDSML